MLAIGLALSASAVLGFNDFFGGTLVRRFPIASVLILSQLAGLAAIGAAAALAGGLHARGFAIGVAAGCVNAIGMVSFYRSMALGTMSVISPLLASGAVLAFAIAIATGERPAPAGVAGALIALLGAVLASFHEHASGGARRHALTLGVVAALAGGSYLYLLGRASEAGGTLSALLGIRLASVPLILAGALAFGAVLHIDLRLVPMGLAFGILTIIGTALLSLAFDRGLLSITAILGSLYPAITVLLAHVLLGERLTPVQKLGLPLTIAGVALVASS